MGGYRYFVIGLVASGCSVTPSFTVDGGRDAYIVPDAGFDSEPDGNVDAGHVISSDFCDRIASGPPSTSEFLVTLSEAHAAIRFFGIEAHYYTVDNALADALDEGGPPSQDALKHYADTLEGVCAIDTTSRQLDDARVELIGSTAVIHPGVGSVALPTGTQSVALDLRDLPDVPELKAALERAVSLALDADFTWPSRHVRQHQGLSDEVYAPGANVYSTEIATIEGEVVTGAQKDHLPLAVIVGERLPPRAAELAAALRIAGRAWLIGPDILAAVAESRWSGFTTRGLAWRWCDLLDEDGTRWPDAIPADYASLNDLQTALSRNDLAPIDLDALETVRPRLEEANPELERPRSALDRRELQVALLDVHGTLRLFFPYFVEVGDRIDERLAETMETASTEPVDRRLAFDLLRRMSEAIHDAHSQVGNQGEAPWEAGYLRLYVDRLDGHDIVTSSGVSNVYTGDEIISIDGATSDVWRSDVTQFVSAATDGNRSLLEWFSRALVSGETTLELRDPDGATRTEHVNPAPNFGTVSFIPNDRPSGWLTEFDAPDVYFINMDSSVTENGSVLLAAVEEGHEARGLVIDMRGYPSVGTTTRQSEDYLEALSRMFGEDTLSPQYWISVHTGPDVTTPHNFQYPMPGPTNMSDAVRGPIALLVGPYTQSSAEDFSTFLVSARDDVTVFGRQSSGTNGNITGMQLPGAFVFTFTGMRVLFPNGDTYHAHGIVPDYEVVPTATDVRDDIDPVLREAVTYLSTGGG